MCQQEHQSHLPKAGKFNSSKIYSPGSKEASSKEGNTVNSNHNSVKKIQLPSSLSEKRGRKEHNFQAKPTQKMQR